MPQTLRRPQAMVGAASVLGGVCRVTISLVVIMLLGFRVRGFRVLGFTIDIQALSSKP